MSPITKNDKPETTYINARFGRCPLDELYAELLRLQETKLDFVCDMRTLKATAGDDGHLYLGTENYQTGEWLTHDTKIANFAIADFCHMLDCPIPVRHMRDLIEKHPSIGGQHLTSLMRAKPRQTRRLVRIMDGYVRACQSGSFVCIDHLDIANSTLDMAQRLGAMPIEARLTDRRMLLKLTRPSQFDSLDTGEGTFANDNAARNLGSMGNPKAIAKMLGLDYKNLPAGPNTVFPLVTVSNSETGDGLAEVSFGLMTGACANGLIFTRAVGKTHVGKKLEQGIYSADTHRKARDLAYSQIRDAINAGFTPEKFTEMCDVAKGSMEDRILAPTAAVDNVAGAGNFTEAQRDALLAHFTRDYTQTRWGLGQAVARLAQDVTGDTATDMERFGGQIIQDDKLIGDDARKAPVLVTA